MDSELGIVMSDFFQKTNVPQNFTQERTGAMYHPIINARDVFHRHIDDAVYYSKMQGTLKIIQKTISKSEDVWGSS